MVLPVFLSATTPDDVPHFDREAALLRHLDSAYTLAQAVTTSAEEATHLVEATYTQAFIQLPAILPEAAVKQRLLNLLMQIHREQQAFSRQDAPDIEQSSPAFGPIDSHRRRLAEDILDQILSTAFATLPEEQQMILLLCEAEALPCTDAAEILAIDADVACQRQQQALTALHEAIHAGTTPSERTLIDHSLPEGWLRESLRHVVYEAYGTPPSSLRPTVKSATPSPVPPVPAPPRLPVATQRAESGEHRQSLPPWLWRGSLALLLIIAAGLIGVLVSQTFEREPETNLIMLAAQQAGAVRPALLTNSPVQAETFIRDEMNWRLTLPSIDNAMLTGVGLHELAPNVTIPVFLYEDTLDAAKSQPITLYVYNYVMLDRYNDRVQLAHDVLRQIQNDQRFDLYDLTDARKVLIWRNRDDIYLAVTPGDAEALRERIVFPS